MDGTCNLKFTEFHVCIEFKFQKKYIANRKMNFTGSLPQISAFLNSFMYTESIIMQSWWTEVQAIGGG